ncbi:hypothetical protein SAMN05421688_0348 [Poseidonocella pacifica]|uniref:Uncharacterized protein n=1 Tax=Poseidonocella pacifica TaxID=871651 RepID=A0A1I0V6K1_9RHOB|nr:hypothetical protein [Poseidonocella pacifica]SFA71959.1 hypothetical protein SAMN05421688_0348 [Poseidonocella pacifica]
MPHASRIQRRWPETRASCLVLNPSWRVEQSDPLILKDPVVGGRSETGVDDILNSAELREMVLQVVREELDEVLSVEVAPALRRMVRQELYRMLEASEGGSRAG